MSLLTCCYFKEYAGDFTFLGVVNGQFGQGEVLQAFDSFALEQFVHHVNSQRGQIADVLEDGDGQFTLDDAVTAVSGGILTGDRDYASQTLGFHRLQSAERGAVIGGDDSVNIIVAGR